jgi:hypothetical protein
MKIQLLLLCSFLLFINTKAFAQQPAEKDVVAIYHFTTSRDYSYDYALGVGNAVEAGVLRSNRFKVVERNRFGSIKEEDKFKEANTTDLVNKAGKMGAKTIITGHVTGVSRGDIIGYDNKPTGKEYIEISLSFKIIDVANGEIKKSEIVSGRGEGKNYAETAQNAYLAIDKVIRANIGSYLPQRFKYMQTLSVKNRKKGEYLETFKIWGGSEDGLKVGDALELYKVNYLVNPNTNQRVEEKQLLGQANITEVHGSSSASCKVIDAPRKGIDILSELKKDENSVLIEYKGNWYVKPSILDILK